MRIGFKCELHFTAAVDLVCHLTSLYLEFAICTIRLITMALLPPTVGCRAQHEVMNVCKLVSAVPVKDSGNIVPVMIIDVNIWLAH